MGYRLKLPNPESRIARSEEFGAALYAELAEIPLYVNLRIITDDPLGASKRRSFRLGWVIGEQRLAHGGDRYTLPADIVAWASAATLANYPDHATASGMSAEEVADMEAEQKEKRKKHNS